MTTVDRLPPQRQANTRWLAGYVAQHRWAAILSLLSGAIGGVTLTLEPYFIGIIIDNVRQGIETEQLMQDILVLLGLTLITVVAFYGQRHFSGIVAYGVSYDIRKTVFDNMVNLDQDFYNHHATGDLISRMYSDMNWIWRLLALTFVRGGSAIVVAILAFILLATVNVTLTFIVFVLLAIATAFQIWAGLFLVKLSEDVQDQAGELSALVQDSVTGIQTIKTFGKEAGVNATFLQENQEYRRRWLRFKRMNEPVGMLPQMMIQLTTGVVVLVGGWMTISTTMTLGNFAQFLLYLALIRQVMLQLGTMYQRFVQTKGALQRLTPMLQEADIRDSDNAQELPNIKGNITLDNVSYRVGISGFYATLIWIFVRVKSLAWWAQQVAVKRFW
jgi:ATP-binding cassette subfamily B multidrug efflux pump